MLFHTHDCQMKIVQALSLQIIAFILTHPIYIYIYIGVAAHTFELHLYCEDDIYLYPSGVHPFSAAGH